MVVGLFVCVMQTEILPKHFICHKNVKSTAANGESVFTKAWLDVYFDLLQNVRKYFEETLLHEFYHSARRCHRYVFLIVVKL